MTQDGTPLHVNYVMDTVCPWCFIGKKRLRTAFDARSDVDPRIRFRAFLLNPNMPREGIDQDTYMTQRFGNTQRVSRILTAVREVGEAVGINFAFERITRTPNSTDSHRMIRLAADRGLAEEMVDALYAAYFIDGRDIGDPHELADIAAGLGFDPQAVLSFLAGTDGIEGVLSDNAWAHRQGANGVPTLAVRRRPGPIRRP